ncbi:MAG: hypothetical protein ABI333_03765 [bacterium]
MTDDPNVPEPPEGEPAAEDPAAPEAPSPASAAPPPPPIPGAPPPPIPGAPPISSAAREVESAVEEIAELELDESDFEMEVSEPVVSGVLGSTAEPEPEPEPAAPADPIADALAGASTPNPRARLDAYLKEMEVETDKERKAVLCYEVGELQEAWLEDEPAAIKSYSKALNFNNRFLPNLWAVRRVFWRRKLWPNLIKLLDAELKFIEDPAHRTTLLMEKGEILRTQQGDAEGAVACYQEAHRIDPAQLQPILILEKHFREQGNLAELFSIMRAHVDASTQPERKTAVLLSMARLEEQLSDADYDRRRGLLLEALESAAHPLRVIRELERIAEREDRLEDHLDALRRREELLLAAGSAGLAGKPATQGEAAVPTDAPSEEALSQAFEDGGAKVGSEEKQAEATAKEAVEEAAEEEGGGGEPARETESPRGTAAEVLEAFAVARLRARLVEKGEQPERAYEILVPWRDRLPEHPVLLGELCGLAARLGKWGELAELLEARQAAAPPEQRSAWELERALALSRAGRTEEAESLLQEFVDADPPQLLVLSLRMLNAETAGDRTQLVALIDRELVAVRSLELGDEDEGRRRAVADLLAQKAGLLMHSPEGEDQAEAACRAAREAASGHPAATDLLEHLLTRKGLWDELGRLYREELVDAEEERAIYLLESLVDLHSIWKPDPEGLVDTLRKLTDQQPESVTAKLCLADALAAVGDAEDEILVLRAVATIADDAPELASDSLVRAARVADAHAEDSSQAVGLLKRALELQPGQPEATVLLEQILQREGRHEELVGFYREEVERTVSEERVPLILLRLGRLLERELGRPGEAAEVYDQLRQRTPGDRGVLAVLARSLEAAGEHERLAEVWELQADATEDLHDKAELYLLLGEHFQDRLGDDARAEEAYLRARASNPADTGSLGALAELSFARREWNKLFEVYDEVLRSEPTEELRRRILSELAWIAEGPLQDGTRARDYWMELATLDPPVPTAFWAAVRLAVSRREWGEAAGALDWLAGLAEKAGEVELSEALTLRAAAYGTVAGVAASSRLVKATGLGDGGGVPLVLATDLAPAEGTEAASRLAQRIESLTPPARRGEFTLLLAWLCERDGELAKAAQVLRENLGGGLADLPLLAVLQQLADRAEDSALYADCCERMADVIQDAGRAGALYREGAERAGQSPDAVRMLRKALERDPEDKAALNALASQLVELEHYAEAAVVLGFHLGQMNPDEETVRLRVERAGLRIEHLKDDPGAAVDLHHVLTIDPDHPVAQLHLATLLARDGGYTEALELLERRLDQANEEDPDHRKIQLLIAEVQERSGQPLTNVLDTLDALLAHDAEDEDVLERKHAVLLRSREWSAAVEVLDRRYQHVPDDAERAAGELRKAAIFQNLAANDDEARTAFEKARQLDPLNREAILGLCALYQKFGDDGSLGYVLSDAVDSYREELNRKGELDPELVRFLATLFEKGGEKDAHYFALATLEALGEASRDEAARAEQYRSALVDRQPGRLTPDLWARYLLHRSALGPAIDLWDLVGPASYRIWPRELTDFGVGKGERIQPKSAAGVSKEIFDLASSLGISLNELYVGGTKPDEIHAVGTSTGPALVVGSRVGPRLGARERHRVGCLLASIRLGTLAFDLISDKDLELFVAAAVREGQPDFSPKLPAARIEELSKKIRKVLSRKERKALTLAGANFAMAGVDLRLWREGMTLTLQRIGLLCSGDIKASTDELMEQDDEWMSLDSPPVRALLMFALSDAHMEARMTLGVAR